MEPTYQQTFHINDHHSDRYGRLKPGSLLYFIQEVAGIHGASLGVDHETLAKKNLFWAILRTRVQITRLPQNGENITLKTWPMPATRVAYPRSVVAFDEAGNEIFRGISIWVLMDMTSRAMVLPGKSGVSLAGSIQGGELAIPGSLVPRTMENMDSRAVRFTDLDVNGHMNNTKYFEWIWDLLPSQFHQDNPLRELVICYLSEAREGQNLTMNWEFSDGVFQVEGTRENEEPGKNPHRVFAAKVLFD